MTACTPKKLLTREVQELASELVQKLPCYNRPWTLAGIPRGGLVAASFIAAAGVHAGFPEPTVVSVAEITSDPRALQMPGQITYLVDDIVVTGETFNRWIFDKGPFAGHLALIEKGKWVSDIIAGATYPDDQWVVFPWEVGEESSGPADAVRRIIECAGLTPSDKVVRKALEFLESLHD